MIFSRKERRSRKKKRKKEKVLYILFLSKLNQDTLKLYVQDFKMRRTLSKIMSAQNQQGKKAFLFIDLTRQARREVNSL